MGTLLDRDVERAITEVLVRYATGVDRRDWELLGTCFTEDCDADYAEIGPWHSRNEIVAWMAETHDPLGPTLHRMTNAVVTADGDRAAARSYVHAVVTTSDRSAAVHAFGLYDDELVLGADGWQIARRRYTSVTTEMHTPMG